MDLEVVVAQSSLTELFLWPHAGCNQRCVSCDIWRDTSRREIDPADVARWAHQWSASGVRKVVLVGGEPLMHHDLFAIAAPLRECGMKLELLSTGPLLTKFAEQVPAYFNAVLVSLDGPPAVHDGVRRVRRAFQLLEAGIRAVREVDPDFTFYARCTVHRYNYKYLPETVRTAERLGIKRMSFIPADLTTEAFNRIGGWDETRQHDLAVPADELPRLAAEIDRLAGECADSYARKFIEESPDHLRTYLYGHYRAFHGLAGHAARTCSRPWDSALLEVDGTVRPCFFLEPYGNVHEVGDLAAVVNSPAAVRWRTDLDVSTNEVCQRCPCFRAVPDRPRNKSDHFAVPVPRGD